MMAFFVEMRGARAAALGLDETVPEQKDEEVKEVAGELEMNGKRAFLRYDDLIDFISTDKECEKEYKKVPEVKRTKRRRIRTRDQIWYDRVRKWCKRKGITLRRVNRVSSKSPEETAALVKGALEDVANAREFRFC
jgi:hypothetical protein